MAQRGPRDALYRGRRIRSAASSRLPSPARRAKPLWRRSARFPADRVLATFLADPAFSGALAIVDGEVIPQDVATIFAAGEQADVPVLIGSNADEGTALFSYLAPAFGTGTAGFEAFVAATLGEASEGVGELYPAGRRRGGHRILDGHVFRCVLRLFDAGLGASHADRGRAMPGSTGSRRCRRFPKATATALSTPPKSATYSATSSCFDAVPTDDDRALSERMATVWTEFARTGNPNGEGLPEWPAYTRENEAYMEFGG